MLKSIKTEEQKPKGPFPNMGDCRGMTTMKMLNLALDPGPEGKKKRNLSR